MHQTAFDFSSQDTVVKKYPIQFVKEIQIADLK